MQTNITGASGKVNYFEADLILTNHRFLGIVAFCLPVAECPISSPPSADRSVLIEPDISLANDIRPNLRLHLGRPSGRLSVAPEAHNGNSG